jgi:hypothetical protein
MAEFLVDRPDDSRLPNDIALKPIRHDFPNPSRFIFSSLRSATVLLLLLPREIICESTLSFLDMMMSITK